MRKEFDDEEKRRRMEEDLKIKLKDMERCEKIVNSEFSLHNCV